MLAINIVGSGGDADGIYLSLINQRFGESQQFEEDIPFGETKSYVFRIMQALGIMKTLYENELK